MDKTMTQIKFTVDPEIATTFKARCAVDGISMTSAFRQWVIVGSQAKEVGVKASDRPRRRKVVREIIDSLNSVLDLEADYRDSIPEQFAQRYEAADRACEMLEEAIACLIEAY